MNEQKPLLRLSGIYKQFPGVYALNNVSLEAFAGEVHALMGENGAGKSTLIKIISGAYHADKGEYFLNGEKTMIEHPRDAIGKKISVIYQEFNLAKDLSVAENIFLGSLPKKKWGRLDHEKLNADASNVLRELHLDIDPRIKVKYLTIAKQQLIEIGKSIAKDPKIIVMDEPTSALSRSEIEGLFKIIGILRDRGTAIIYVSHKLEEVFAVSQRITVLRDGKLVGSCETSAINEDALISMMVGRQLSDMYQKQYTDIGKTVLEVKNLSTDYVHDISFSVKAGEIVGFSGLMGSGRTELCRAIFGLDKRRKGSIFIEEQELIRNSPENAVQMGLGFIPENRKDEGIFPNLSVRDNMTLVALDYYIEATKINHRKEQQAVDRMVDAFSIKTPSQKQCISNLSGGNQQKVIVARWLMEGKRKVLIVDEPTRGIDIGAKSEIYSLLNQLAKEGMSIIIMSSEMPELLGLTDRIFVIKNGKISGVFKTKEVTQEELLIAAT
jgi:ABC-type sugar transport system ATPase subunit